MTKPRAQDVTIQSLLRVQASGARTCIAIAIAAAQRASEVERAGLRVFLTLNPNLLDDAASLDRLRHDGRMLPLHGIPVALKDNIGTADMPTTGGAVALRGMQPARDASVVARLRSAGALILGKTNMDELAVGGSSISSLGGQVLNPWDRTRNPAGSSGGAAVAVTTGVVVAAIGTETVNSIRNPANVTGIVGVRPSRGLVGRTGVIPLSPTMDVVGPMARTVADAAAILQVIVGRDPLDPATATTLEFASEALVPPWGASLVRKRIGVLRELFGADPDHAGTNALIDAALACASSAGAEIVEIRNAGLDTAQLVRRMNLSDWEFRGAFEAYLAGQGDRAPLHTVAEYVADRRFVAGTMETFLRNALRWNAAQEEPAYWECVGHIAAMRAQMLRLFADHRLDVLAYPAMKRPAYGVDEDVKQDRNGVLASALGFPAINLPVGLTVPSKTAPFGLPVGLDLMGAPRCDAALIGLAATLETVVPGRPFSPESLNLIRPP